MKERLGICAFALASFTVGCADLKMPPTALEPTDITEARGGVPSNVIAVSPAAATLGASMTLQLTAVVTNQDGVIQQDREIAFTSDAPEVASVDAAGLVTAHEDGTAHITASTGGPKLTAVATIAVRTGPTVMIVLAPFYQGMTAGSGQAPFSVVGDFPQVEFSCRLNGTVEPCGSSISWSGLPHGSELVIEVSATDVSTVPHITGPTARAVATIDAQAPTITDVRPTGTTGPNVFIVFASDDSPANGVVFACSIDGGAPTVSFPESPIGINNLTDGLHGLTIVATDPVGNTTTATSVFFVDALGPVFDAFATRAPAGPVGPQSTAETAILFTAVDQSIPVTYRCSLDGSVYASCSSPETAGKFEWSGLSAGSHTLSVIAYDAFNNHREPLVVNFLVVVPTG